MAVMLISSELEEVIGLAHRVLVMRHGEIVNEFSDVGLLRTDPQPRFGRRAVR